MISVVIATHNRIGSLKKALLSIYAQTLLPKEIIIVDDASIPKVPDSIFDACPDGVDVKLIRNSCSLKASGARNIGVRYASAQYIAFLDDDDQFFSDKLRTVTDCINQNNSPDVIYHGAEIFLMNENICYFTRPKTYPIDVFFKKMLISNVVGGTPMVVAKRMALIDSGLFDEKLPAVEDYELWMRMAKSGLRFFCINEPLTKCFYESRRISVSKHDYNNIISREMIDFSYKEDLKALSEYEKKLRRESVFLDSLQRNLLNYQYFKSLSIALRILNNRLCLDNLMRVMAVALGTKASFRIRSWAKPR